MTAGDEATEAKRRGPIADESSAWPFDMNRPWLRPPREEPYAVERDWRVDSLVEKWRDLVRAHDALIERIQDGDTRAERELADLDGRLTKYPGPRVFEELVREVRVDAIKDAVAALSVVIRQVRAGTLSTNDSDDGDVVHAAEACRVPVRELQRSVFNPEVSALLHQRGQKGGVKRAAVHALSICGAFGSAATIWRRLDEHKTRPKQRASSALSFGRW